MAISMASCTEDGVVGVGVTSPFEETAADVSTDNAWIPLLAPPDPFVGESMADLFTTRPLSQPRWKANGSLSKIALIAACRASLCSGFDVLEQHWQLQPWQTAPRAKHSQ